MRAWWVVAILLVAALAGAFIDFTTPEGIAVLILGTLYLVIIWLTRDWRAEIRWPLLLVAVALPVVGIPGLLVAGWMRRRELKNRSEVSVAQMSELR